MDKEDSIVYTNLRDILGGKLTLEKLRLKMLQILQVIDAHNDNNKLLLYLKEAMNDLFTDEERRSVFNLFLS